MFYNSEDLKWSWVNRSALAKLVGETSAAAEAAETTDEGLDAGDPYWGQADVDALAVAVTSAQAVLNNEDAAQEDIIAAYKALDAAYTAFKDAVKYAGVAAGPWEIGNPNAADVKAWIYEDGTFAITGEGDTIDRVIGVSYWYYATDSEGKQVRDSVTSVTFGEGVSPDKLDDYFQAMHNLQEVADLPESVTSIRGTFSHCTSLGAIPNLPDGLQDMYQACYQSTSLTETPVIPDTVTNMQRAFIGTAITEAPLLPEGVTNLQEAFSGCLSLNMIPAGFSVPEGATTTDMFYVGSPYSESNLLTTYCDAADYEALSALPWASWNRKLVAREDEGFKITTQPVDATAALKQKAEFAIATNDEGATYRWEYSNDDGKTWGQSYLTGWKMPEFSFAVTAARADRLYRCKVTFSDGTVEYSDTVSVVEPKADESIKVTATPEKASAKLKDTVEFKASVEGAEDADNYTFLWYYSENDGENWAQSYLTGWKTDTFSFAVTSARADRIYRVKATAPSGAEIFSEPVSIELASDTATSAYAVSI